MNDSPCEGASNSLDPALSNVFMDLGGKLAAIGAQMAPQFAAAGAALTQASALTGGENTSAGAGLADTSGQQMGDMMAPAADLAGGGLSAGMGMGDSGGEGEADPNSAGGEEEGGEDPRITKEKSVVETIQGLWEGLTNATSGLNENRKKGESDAWEFMKGEAVKGLQKLAVVQKAMRVKSIIMDTQAAVTKAYAEVPFPLNIPAAAMMAAKGAANLSKVKGIFHDGIANVPSTGTYLLEQGERVVDRRLNADLKGFLRGQQASAIPASPGASSTVNRTFSPQISIQGPVDDGVVNQLEERLRDIYAEKLDTGFV